MKGNLYLIATPIGNKDDISKRVIDTFKKVDKLYAEDTRETKKLLSFYDLDKKMTCLNDHNESKLVEKIIEDLQNGLEVGLVSDRGTPLISDPGYKIVNGVRNLNFNVIAIPGPVAFINALIASGLPTDKFTFYGFSNYKKDALAAYLNLPGTIIFYESPKRIGKLVSYLLKELGDREVVVARELTKKFETFYFGNLSNILTKDIEYKGEFVVMVGPPVKVENVNLTEEVENLLNMDYKQLVGKVLKENFGLSRNEIYKYLNRKE